MSSYSAQPHITDILDIAATTQAGITVYGRGQKSKASYLSYSELRTLATLKAGLLRRYIHVSPGKIFLIHFHNHIETIIWFWASVLAGCLPTISTPFVQHREGRISHFKHLHSLLLDPIVITTQTLVDIDFADNTVLRVVSVEYIERLSHYESSTFRGIPNCFSTNVLSSHEQDENGVCRFGKTCKGTADSLASDPTCIHCGINSDLLTNSPTFRGTSKFATILPKDGNRSTEHLAALMLTSGSSGNAKAVCLTHKQLLAAIRAKISAMPVPDGCAILNWIALDHVASLVEIHMCGMFAGQQQVHVPALDVIGNPLLFLRLLSKHRVARTFAPNFFLSKLKDTLNAASANDTDDIDLHELLFIASGGEPNSVDTCVKITKNLIGLGATKRNIVTPGFGMTETCAGAIYNQRCPDIDVEMGSDFASLGTCIPGIEMRISSLSHAGKLTDQNSHANPQGELELRGPIIFERYFNNEDATRAAFTDDGWFKTGDLAFIDPEGYLKLAGRSKELIIINGVKHLPHEIESAVDQARITGVAESFVVCFAHRSSISSAEEIYVVYQHEYSQYDYEARMDAMQSIVRTVVLSAAARPRVLPLAPGLLQKTSLGKLSRAKVQTSLTKGQYKDQEDLNSEMLKRYHTAHHSEPQDETEKTLMTLFLENLGLDDLQMGTETLILNTGVSSVDLIRLKSACETRFDIAEIPMVTILTNTTIRSLAAAIKAIRNTQYQAEYDPVVTLQYIGSETPLWLIHPGIGEILVFLGLVSYFPDRPIHALRARGFSPGEEPFIDLTEVVETYHRAVKKQQPHGPYAIAGYSYGSMLAFEIAKKLEANHDTVNFLGSFNLPPHIKERMRMLDHTAGLLHIAHFCAIISEQRSEELVDELRLLSQAEQVTKVLAESDQQRCTELALTHSSLLNWTDIALSLQKIGWEYDPSGSVSSMDVFYCQPLKSVAKTRQEYRETKLNRWVDFVRGDVRFHEVDGEHYTMIGPDYVSKFQQTLKQALAARGA